MQSKQNIDVLIIGVGAAGLMAWRELHSVGLHVVVLEARDRIGGRILTDHSTSSPIELGAEFVHGKPKAIWPILEKARLKMLESSDTRMVFDKEAFVPARNIGKLYKRSTDRSNLLRRS